MNSESSERSILNEYARAKRSLKQPSKELAARVLTSRGTNHWSDRLKEKTAWTPLSSGALTEVMTRFEGTEFSCCQATRGFFAEMSIAEYRLQLHALVWPEDGLLNPEATELSLLLVLSPSAIGYLPIGTEITIAEHNLLHSGQNLRWGSNPTYLYTQVFGEWEKRFTVQVALPSGASVTLPPLTFSQS